MRPMLPIQLVDFLFQGGNSIFIYLIIIKKFSHCPAIGVFDLIIILVDIFSPLNQMPQNKTGA